jgi:hypothetical protein
VASPNYSGVFSSNRKTGTTWDTGDRGYISPSNLKYPDYSGSFDSGKDSTFSDIWKRGFGFDRDEIFSTLFDKTKQTDKYRSRAERQEDSPWPAPRAGFGEPTSGRGVQLLDNLSALYPQQHAPVYMAGVEGKKGLGSTIGHIAGTIGGALIGGPVGGVVAGLGGPIGGLFG